jgi:SpoVK/Ycf46/Vps4 family AAA+-type ATPase
VVRGAELFSAYTGEGEKNIRQLFAKARQTSPCVIFFDEIDALGRARKDAGPGGDSSAERILNQLLIEMDSRPPATQKDAPVVFVIGATNRPDILDPALIRFVHSSLRCFRVDRCPYLRTYLLMVSVSIVAACASPGRLDQLIYVGLPDRAARLSILQTLLRSTPLDTKLCTDYVAWKKTHPPKSKPKSEPATGTTNAEAKAITTTTTTAASDPVMTLDQVLSEIADQTEQYSGADLAAICNRYVTVHPAHLLIRTN